MKKILIIEDDKDIAEGLKETLEDEGYRIALALDGQKGLEQISQENFELIICDLMMPEINGFEVISEIRKFQNELPIIILSARIDIKDKVRALDLGADDYLTKPFSSDELLARINRKLNIRKKSDYSFNNWKINSNSNQLFDTQNNKTIMLNTREQKLLLLFLQKKIRS